MSNRRSTVLLLVVSALVLIECGRHENETIPLIPAKGADFVVLLRKDLPPEEVLPFTREVLGQPISETQHRHRPGVRSVVKVAVQDYVAYAVAFFPDAPAEQRAALRKLICGSPAVYKLLEDVRPEEIIVPEDSNAGPC